MCRPTARWNKVNSLMFQLSKHLVDQRLLVDLAHDVARYAAEHAQHTRHLVARHPLLGKGLDVFQR